MPDSLLGFIFEYFGRVHSIWGQTFREGPFKGGETGTRFVRIHFYSGAVLPPYHFGDLSVAVVHDNSKKCC